jgi:hypothetical protein
VRTSISAFTASFSLNAPDIVAAKEARFTKYLRAAVGGNLFARPKVKPTWTAHFTWETPMPEVQQLSYDDVEAELNRIRSRFMNQLILFVGGDGLSIHRIIWLMLKYPDLYIDSAPLIIPVQGESPHGVFHIMHAGWRLYWRFLRWCAKELKRPDKAVKDDPLVSDFNTHFYFLLICTRACAEYIAELQQTGPGVDNPQAIMEEAERNVALAWVCHFLFDFAFMVWEFKQGVRAADHATLDRLWREFFASGHTSTANKTLYVPMSIMKVWQSKALSPPLLRLLNKARSIPLSDKEGAMVGWDLPCEHLNGYLTRTVQGQVSPEAIDKAVHRYPLLEHNHHMLTPQSSEHVMKEMEEDVATLKAALTAEIGNNWRAAMVRRTQTPWTSSQRDRGRAPWLEVQATMTKNGRDSVAAFIAQKARQLTASYYAFAP